MSDNIDNISIPQEGELQRMQTEVEPTTTNADQSELVEPTLVKETTPAKEPTPVQEPTLITKDNSPEFVVPAVPLEDITFKTEPKVEVAEDERMDVTECVPDTTISPLPPVIDASIPAQPTEPAPESVQQGEAHFVVPENPVQMASPINPNSKSFVTSELQQPTPIIEDKREDPPMPTRQYLDTTVVPILLQALAALSKDRPSDPVDYLANYLLNNKDKVKGGPSSITN
uniref:Dosage compensation protein dpy-30 n=1 Tax=Rhabditophanes sp. KR3021 TaxID=114890 RepID=A0AC35TQL1_9BILA